MVLSFAEVEAARERISPYILRTPLLRVPALDAVLGCEVYLKPENLQYTGSFKLRGATNRLLAMTEEQRRCGVVAASSGNHAQGVACAAKRLGVDAVIIMPTNCNPVKLAGVKAFGATVLLVGTLSSQREERAAELVEREGRTSVPPFADPYVAAGQGTIGLEILEDCAELDTVVVPIG
ncbi:MAG: pyridoxal-phosphate dependent enzyme, partial [Oscillospiraceae bacterium]